MGNGCVDAVRYRSLWLDEIREAGVRRRTEFYYQQLDALRSLRQEVRRELLAESARHKATLRFGRHAATTGISPEDADQLGLQFWISSCARSAETS